MDNRRYSAPSQQQFQVIGSWDVWIQRKDIKKVQCKIGTSKLWKSKWKLNSSLVWTQRLNDPRFLLSMSPIYRKRYSLLNQKIQLMIHSKIHTTLPRAFLRWKIIFLLLGSWKIKWSTSNSRHVRIQIRKWSFRYEGTLEI